MIELHSLSSLKNIIFDLGGVLYHVNYGAVEKALAALQDANASNAPTYSRFTQPDCVTQFECGLISERDFRDALRKEFAITACDEVLDKAWCAILGGAYAGRVQFIKKLRQRYRVVLLSNTNSIHLAHVQAECPELLSALDSCFYSHEMKMRKPEPAIFTEVLARTGFQPEETLFLDDSPQHLQAAEQLGIHTAWVQQPESVELLGSLLLGERGV